VFSKQPTKNVNEYAYVNF